MIETIALLAGIIIGTVIGNFLFNKYDRDPDLIKRFKHGNRTFVIRKSCAYPDGIYISSYDETNLNSFITADSVWFDKDCKIIRVSKNDIE